MQKHFTKLFLFLILLPAVSASSFTGSINDGAIDTDGDGLFNYLTINISVSIDKVRNHIIYGLLKDSLGNSLEYSSCMSLTHGTYPFSLDFDGKTIYRNKIDGPYTLSELKLFSAESCSNDIKDVVNESFLINAHTTNYYSYKQFQKGEPALYCNNSPCIASSDLIKSRDNLDIPEPNAPNTIDNCEDGSSGTYLNDESIESITVTSLNHSNYFEIGDTIMVDIRVYCSDGSDDKLNFVYTNNIDNIKWEVKDTKQCTSTGLKTLSTTFNLDNKIGNHSIRGVFGFGLKNNAACGEDDTQYHWADTDDIVIYVKGSEKHKIDLTKGWNLLSLPKIDNNSINETIKLFNNNFEKIVTLKNNKWYIYDKLNLANSNLNELSESNGFWIKVNNNQSILIENESAAYTSFQLAKGWNLVGYPSLEEKDVNELFQNVIDDIELIYTYNNKFSSFNPQNPTTLIIKPGTGIFVKIKTDMQWYFDDIYNKGEELPKFNLNLSEGWNLISIPLTSNKTIAKIFGPTKLYYSENNKWKQLENKINYSYGYWIKTSESSLIIEGTKINNLNFNLNKGWNLINYPLDKETTINIFFQNVMDNIESIANFEDGNWKTYIPLRPNNSLTILKPGKGIFIKTKNNAKWNFNGNELVAD